MLCEVFLILYEHTRSFNVRCGVAGKESNLVNDYAVRLPSWMLLWAGRRGEKEGWSVGTGRARTRCC